MKLSRRFAIITLNKQSISYPMIQSADIVAAPSEAQLPRDAAASLFRVAAAVQTVSSPVARQQAFPTLLLFSSPTSSRTGGEKAAI